jgi:hypothetical protein
MIEPPKLTAPRAAPGLQQVRKRIEVEKESPTVWSEATRIKGRELLRGLLNFTESSGVD